MGVQGQNLILSCNKPRYSGIWGRQILFPGKTRSDFTVLNTLNHITDNITGAPASREDQQELVYSPARLLASRMRAGSLSAREVMEAFLGRIEQCNPGINAICTLIPEEQALKLADAADRALRRGDETGPLHGLPIAIKDLSDTRGIRTTLGSPIFSDNIPVRDSLLVQRIRQAGALVIGKTNTPEFGAGSHTFNALFGVTRNPYDPDKTAGGSSGGAAAAVACRHVAAGRRR